MTFEMKGSDHLMSSFPSRLLSVEQGLEIKTILLQKLMFDHLKLSE